MGSGTCGVGSFEGEANAGAARVEEMEEKQAAVWRSCGEPKARCSCREAECEGGQLSSGRRRGGWLVSGDWCEARATQCGDQRAHGGSCSRRIFDRCCLIAPLSYVTLGYPRRLRRSGHVVIPELANNCVD